MKNEWRESYLNFAKTASAMSDGGGYAFIIGVVTSIMESDYIAASAKVARVRFLLEAFHKAKEAAP